MLKQVIKAKAEEFSEEQESCLEIGMMPSESLSINHNALVILQFDEDCNRGT